ncbi:RagB/SusD family nutrient uptake outer membrane protein [Puteibacter caeruleilacunae]|nr:RagB/SusD family nutrient uptake outer membrane protein [Puteibacter caeruleilacunae]
MIKKLKLFILTFALLGMVACNDYLDVVPDGVGTIDYAFIDAYAAEGYLSTCYRYLPNSAGWSSNPALLGADEVWVHDNEVIASNRLGNVRGNRLAEGEQSRGKVYFDFWNGSEGGKDLWEGIRHCNVLIERISAVPDMTEEEHKRYIAEAKFLKAYYYFYLLRMYGPVPLIKENIPVSAGVNEVKLERSPLEEGFSYVVELLEESFIDLPEYLELEGLEAGRATQLTNRALKARVLVTAASPLFNGEGLSLKNLDGTELFPQQKDMSKWETAKIACREAIDLAHSQGKGLYYFNDVFSVAISDSTKQKMNIRGAMTAKWNQEIIWGTTIKNGMTEHQKRCPTTWVNQSSEHNSMKAGANPTLNVAELFYTKNGIPMEEDKDFDYLGRYDQKEVEVDHRYFMKVGSLQPNMHFNREVRFYADLAFDGSSWWHSDKMDDKDPRYIKCKQGEIHHRQNNFTGYFIKKNVNYKNTYGTDNRATIDDLPWPEMRLADLYLLYSEAANEVLPDGGVPTDDVYEYINLVRERASLPTVQDAWTNYSSLPNKYKTKEGMREIIRRERAIEMCMEGQRFWDLRRWRIGHEELNQSIKGWKTDEEGAEEYYKPRTIFSQTFTQKDYFWPIAESNIVNNTNLVQNQGW